MWHPLFCLLKTTTSETPEAMPGQSPNGPSESVIDNRWMHPRFLALFHKERLSSTPGTPPSRGHTLDDGICRDENCPCMNCSAPTSLPRPFEAGSGLQFSVLNTRPRINTFGPSLRAFINQCGSHGDATDTSLERSSSTKALLGDDVRSSHGAIDDYMLPSGKPARFKEQTSDMPPSPLRELVNGSRQLPKRPHPAVVRRKPMKLDLSSLKQSRGSSFARMMLPSHFILPSTPSSLPGSQVLDEDIEDYIIDVLGGISGIPIEFQNDYRAGMRLARTRLLDRFGPLQLSRCLGILNRVIEDAPDDPNEASFLGVWARWKFPHAHRNARLPPSL